ncbi:MAG: response regulator [Pseudomonadota bacterium]
MNMSAPDILLVEDSQSDIELFMFAHQRNKSTAVIRIVRDGVEALDLLLGNENRTEDVLAILPRLVLLDLNMPRLTGFDVLERLRTDERTRRLPIVIFSSSDQSADKLEAHRLGANDYVRKPAQFKDLCAILAQFEHDWLSVDVAS